VPAGSIRAPRYGCEHMFPLPRHRRLAAALLELAEAMLRPTAGHAAPLAAVPTTDDWRWPESQTWPRPLEADHAPAPLTVPTRPDAPAVPHPPRRCPGPSARRPYQRDSSRPRRATSGSRGTRRP